MARVYEARRESLAGVSPKVAIKVILPEHAEDETFQQLFVNEARIGSQLQHQNLVQIQDFDRAGRVFFLVMEFVEGLTLRKAASLCRRHGVPIPLAVIAELGRQVCEGLHAAHTACSEDGADLELVHRDIKPSNLILSPQGVVKVLDFGISKALVAAEHAGTVKGTWGYMSPEQAAADDQVWHAADQYGLAAVLYELAMLQPLYTEREPRDLVNLMHADEGARRAARLSGPHAALGPLLMRALQRDPHARYPSCASMAMDLASLIPEPVSARDQLLRFYATVLALDRSEGAAVERSSSTFSRAGVSKGTMDPYSAGLPVAVGNERHPHQVAIDERPAPAPQRYWSTGALAWMGVGILVVAFVSIKLFWPGDAEIEAPQVRSSVLSPAPDPVVVDAPDVTPPVVEAVVAPPLEPVVEPTVPVEPVVVPVVKPKEPRVVKVPAEPKGAPGLLTVSSLPKAKVSVDGKVVGQTPLYQYSLGAGSHKVVLTAEDGRSKSFSLNVSSGEESRRIWHFEKEEWVER
jgi:serine/threonine-protein kinase